ncbi:MAG: excinuclease ABC subunit UvrB [Planctomycetes bacterium]|nr:excinuclease ABC subunit UvrB [Planctomycetota bacterium]
MRSGPSPRPAAVGTGSVRGAIGVRCIPLVPPGPATRAVVASARDDLRSRVGTAYHPDHGRSRPASPSRLAITQPRGPRRVPLASDLRPRAARRGTRSRASRRATSAVRGGGRAVSGRFELRSAYEPRGDQPAAIEALVAGFAEGRKRQVLRGVTGSGKTFTMANVVQALQRPTLVLAHNKTLAAQLYDEFRTLFPENAVEYFVSYYDYYQPEAYVPRTDTYIEKEAFINERIERLRNSATRSLLERSDVLIVASVSCIYGLGSPEYYEGLRVTVSKGQTIDRDDLLRELAGVQYQRAALEFRNGTFRVRGDVVEVFPVYEEDRVVRIEFFDDEVEAIAVVDPLRGEILEEVDSISIYPASHYITPRERLEGAIESIRAELEGHLLTLRGKGLLLEAQRLEQRTRFDLEVLEESGVCSGIENYSRHLDGRRPGDPPATLIHYLPDDYLVIVDESHQSLPQVGAMRRGDFARKTTLVEHGFRLPSAIDNRPLGYEEFDALLDKVLYVSATPAALELRNAGGRLVEQIIRPTGLLDPEVIVRPARGQVDDLLSEIRAVNEGGERVLVTTLTKRMAEELTDHYASLGVKVKYMHSDIDSIERVEIIRGLRLGEFDVLVGINLLREGLDLPEVALVAVLDADKTGFLRSATSLIQTMGRAARNVHGRVIFYAEQVTDAMRQAIDEADRRRTIQRAYNDEHGIVPTSTTRAVDRSLALAEEEIAAETGIDLGDVAPGDIGKRIAALRKRMMAASEALEFEKAAALRDEMLALERLELRYR